MWMTSEQLPSLPPGDAHAGAVVRSNAEKNAENTSSARRGQIVMRKKSPYGFG
jgi:hypothetical protein